MPKHSLLYCLSGGLDQCGPLEALCTPISSAGIGVACITSATSAFVMVRTSEFAMAKEALEASSFQVCGIDDH